jgi:hypothetical protein
MAILFQNPLKNVGDPEEIEQYIAQAISPESTYQQQQEARGWLRGAIQIAATKGQRVAVMHMWQAVRARPESKTQ